MLTALDHVNLQTEDPDGMAEWYQSVLGLRRGPRPDFSIRGVWMYLGEQPVVHLVEVSDRPDEANVSLEHFAFRAVDMAAFEARLNEKGVPFDRVDLTAIGLDLVQYNVRDPMGTHIHIDFRPSVEAVGFAA